MGEPIAGSVTETPAMPVGCGDAVGSAPVRGVGRAGPLRQAVTITLHTRIAGELWEGRRRTHRRPALLGVDEFAHRVHSLSRAAALDDPYADWWLCRAQRALEDGRRHLQRFAESLEQYTAQQLPQGVHAEAVASDAVERIPVRFATPLGFMAAYLLVDFDQVARLILSAQHLALLNASQGYQMMGQATRIVRLALRSTYGFRRTGVTRADVAAGTKIAHLAAQQMGACPQNILERARRGQKAL